MNCTRYRKWIKSAALNSLDASRHAKLAAHLAECERCRGLLATERQLAETIDLAVSASVSASPSPDFAARVRARLAEESERAQPSLAWVRSGWFPASVAGFVALAAFIAVVWPAWRHRKQPQPVKQTVRMSAPNTPAVASVSPTATDQGRKVVVSNVAHGHVSSAAARPGHERGRTRNSAGAEDSPPQFQVMVEPGQGRAILAAYRAAQSARVGLDALAQTSDANEQPEKIKPIEVSPVVVAELYPEEPTKPIGN